MAIWDDDNLIQYTIDMQILGKKEKKMNKLEGIRVDRIDITRKDDEVIARAYMKIYRDNNPDFVVVHKASAKCGPNDIFDFNIGAKLAMDRLYEGYDMTPKPKRKPYNGKIFIHCGIGCIILDNHTIYYVRNGMIMSKKSEHPIAGCHEPYIFEDMSDDELSKAIDDNVFYGKHYNKPRARHYTAYFAKE